jgi:hypothetical protein
MQNPFPFRCAHLAVRVSLLGFILMQTTHAAVNFTVSPNLIGNTYVGPVTFTITGLTNTEKVVVQDFADVNSSGTIDGADIMVQQFRLTDGQALTFNGKTNINVPGDQNSATGALTAQFNFQADAAGSAFVGSYAFRLSSPSSRFAPLTNSFTVTNKILGQSFTGTVRNSGTNVPNAFAVLLTAGANGDHNLVGGTVANASGAYSFQANPGTYLLAAFKSNYLGDFNAPLVTLGSGATVSTNISMTNATRSISGRVVDDVNANLGLGGVFVTANGTNGQVSITFTDTNGNFTLPATAQQWSVHPQDESLAGVGYLGLQDGLKVNVATGSVSGLIIAATKATAMFYGSVKDDQGHPLSGIHLFSNGDSFEYNGSGESDVNGNYSCGTIAGFWQVEVDFGATAGSSNYVFVESFNYTNVDDGDAILVNFVGKLATNHITGTLKDNFNNPIPNIEIQAVGRLGSTNYTAPNARTAADGSFAFTVPDGTWFINARCGDPAQDDSAVDMFNYDCAPTKTVFLAGSPGIANLVATNLHPVLSSPRKPANNQFQFLLNGISGRSYAVLYSTNLTAWLPLYTTNAPSNSFSLLDLSAGGSRRFYRAQMVAGPFSLNFSEFAYPGNFGGNLTPTVTYPVTLNSYRAVLGVGYDIGNNFADPSSVSFTGPGASGLSGTPADYSLPYLLNGAGETYFSPNVFTPAAAPGGAWNINYAGAIQSFTVADPQAASRLVIPLPTLTTNGSLLQSVSWVFKNATNGATLGGAPAYLTSIQLQLEDGFGDQIYNSPKLAPTTTSHTLSTQVDIGDVATLYMLYTDSLGNSYSVTFSQ